MTHYVIGLGNPEDEYKETRHNTGKMVLNRFSRAHAFPAWETDKKYHGFVSTGTIGKEKVLLIKPGEYMNKAGICAKALPINGKNLGKLIVVYDDLDLPLGKFKISFDRSSGGHKGLESIIKSLKSKAFWRIRVGISKKASHGGVRKPDGEKKILNFLLKSFTAEETKTINALSKK